MLFFPALEIHLFDKELGCVGGNLFKSRVLVAVTHLCFPTARLFLLQF
jgi:hypothetical protein